ncbi:MAG TPA: phenylalanine--tRNA ligase subunit beta, partial [Bacteroidales bacterium]|nr:phenylalanine--tRNA ligase subunit beta [Bacteroidales bacterium]
NIARLLTNSGLEVEGIEYYESVKGGLKGVVVGNVLTCEKHPNADALTITTVDIGDDKPLNIVCGAPNVQAGQKVAVATVGTTLHHGGKTMVIGKTRIRSIESEGMICAEDELCIGDSHEGIMVLDPKAVPGTPAAEYFNVVTDTILEIGITPNRSDALSYIGIARDLTAAWNAQYPSDPTRWKTLRLPEEIQLPAPDNSHAIELIVEDHHACVRYSGVTVRDITVKDSPQWLKDFLLASGVRPINNIVDITNFVMLEMGQPLHAFDTAKISGNKVIVKKLAEGTPFVTLDHIQRNLTASDLMICNTDEAMCIAGVYGGTDSAVNESTTCLFLESACFDPITIRRTSKHHGLKTDASFRFERGTDPNITVTALKRATALILDIAGGSVASEITDIYPFPVSGKQIEISYKEINNLIGNNIAPAIVHRILEWLGITIYEQHIDGLVVIVSPAKHDVTRPADLIEEILRIYGYNNIDFDKPLKLSISPCEKPDQVRLKNTISDWLSSNGFNEIMCNSLTKESLAEELGIVDKAKYVRLLNPISRDLDAMRQTLLFGALETVIFNINRKIPNLQLYEFGIVYSCNGESRPSENPLGAYIEKRRLSIILTGKQYPSSWYSEDR